MSTGYAPVIPPEDDDMAEDEVKQETSENEDQRNPDDKAQLPVPVQYIGRYLERGKEWMGHVSERFDLVAEVVAPRVTDDAVTPEGLARRSVLFGLFSMLLMFGIFGLWSVLAPIDSAAIAAGRVVLDSNKKTIDHLEGGIVEEILVQEGMAVEEGQVLIRLDDTAARARLDLYKGQFVAAQATESRLIAERDAKEDLVFPESLLEQLDSDPNIAANVDSQRRLFVTRREAVDGRIDILGQKIKQSEEEIKGLEEQIKSANEQLRLLNEEIGDVRYLLKSGNAAKTRLLALERRAAEIQGEKGERQAMISRAHQTINEAKIEKYNLRTEFLNEVVAELKETQVKLSDLEEQLRAAENVVHRIELRSPITGEVTSLNVHTVGGVISPGQPIMDIVPFDDKLVVEARVQPQDIDVVRKGLTARVRLTAYKTRSVPPVEGTVVGVSADRIDDERTGESYFNARIEIDEEQLQKLEGVELSPGMPAEVLIVTGSRTLFAYLVAPISDSFNRAFREQ